MALSSQQYDQLKQAGYSDADIAQIDAGQNSTPVQPKPGLGLQDIAKGYDTAKKVGAFENAPASAAVPSTLSEIGGVAGAVYGAKTAYDGAKAGDPIKAGLGGLGAVAGLNTMGYALGPWGVAATIAAPALIGAVNKFTDKDQWKSEQKNLAKLRAKGINIPQQEADTLTAGRSTDQLAGIEQSKINAGKYGNVDFAKTRDIKYLKPEDTWGSSDWFSQLGNDYLEKYTEDQRRTLNQTALDKGAISEGNGKVSIDFSKLGDINQILSGKSDKPIDNNNIKLPAGMKVAPDQGFNGDAAFQASLADMYKGMDKANAIQAGADRKSKLLGMVPTGNIDTAKATDYKSYFKNQYA